MKKLRLALFIFAYFNTTLAFCQSGTLDHSFGSGGIVTMAFEENFHVNEVIVQEDGKTLVVGTVGDWGQDHHAVVIRYLIDGLLDPTFGNGGVFQLAGPRSEGESILVQPDGKILVGGSISSINNFDALVLRLNKDGSIDTNFGENGIYKAHFNGAEFCRSLALQTDGKIVLVGGVSNGGGTDFVAFRCNSDGTVDESYGYNGRALVHIVDYFELSEDCLIQEDGKIVIVGSRSLISNLRDIMLVRLNTNGSIDSTFGGDGIVTTDFLYGNDRGKSCAIQSDGKILVAGRVDVIQGAAGDNFDFSIARYNTDGSLDSTFNGDGILTCDIDGENDLATAIHVEWNGAILVSGGGSVDGNTQFALLKYTSDEILDASFGDQGKVTTSQSGFYDMSQTMAVYKDATIVLAGESKDSLSGKTRLTLARYFNRIPNENSDQPNQSDLSVYPNPIEEYSILRYDLEQEERVSILVYDAEGSLVQTIVKDELQSKGKKAIHLKLNDSLAEGLYSIRLMRSSKNDLVKILKL